MPTMIASSLMMGSSDGSFKGGSTGRGIDAATTSGVGAALTSTGGFGGVGGMTGFLGLVNAGGAVAATMVFLYEFSTISSLA